MGKSKRSNPHLKKSRKRSNQQVQVEEDRLSELPDSILFHILWFVPMNYVVRTTILSKRWRNLWTASPFLNFYSAPDWGRDEAFLNFVNQALLRWNGVRVLKFRVDYQFDDEIYIDSEMYVHFAKEKGAEELYLDFPFVNLYDFDDNGGDVYFTPQCLYSCSSLTLLSLSFFNFRIDGDVHWNQLKSLTITKGLGVTEHVVNQILCGSPKLEVLSLSFVDEGHNLNIQSDSLKELLICKHFLHHKCVSMVSELTISTPNLETLTIKGTPYGNCRLVNVKSSAHVTLGFYGAHYTFDDDCDFEIDSGGFISPQDYIGEKIRQVLETIQHFERVTLFCCCLKVLGAMRVRCMRGSSFPSVKSLEIGCYLDHYGQLVGILDIFPQLKRLVLQDDRELHYLSEGEPDELKREVYFPKCLLLQLRTIEVTGSSIYIFPSIESLLKYAHKLEKLMLRVDRNGGENLLFLASHILPKMPKSSANCAIDILEV